MIRIARNATIASVAALRATIAAVRLRLVTKWNVDMLYTCMNTMQDNYDSTVGTNREQPFNHTLFDRLVQATAKVEDLLECRRYTEANHIALAAYDEYVKA